METFFRLPCIWGVQSSTLFVLFLQFELWTLIRCAMKLGAVSIEVWMRRYTLCHAFWEEEHELSETNRMNEEDKGGDDLFQVWRGGN